MTKSPLPLTIGDLSQFTRHLARQLGDAAPSHLTLMNMLARAGGYQNHQHLRSSTAAGVRLAQSAVPSEQTNATDQRLIERTLAQFDDAGRLRQWPSRRSVQTLALFVLWSRIPAATAISEKDINTRLNEMHSFEDPATLRRTMISCGLLQRERDGSNYQRREQAPPPEALALISRLRPRWAAPVSVR